jgi:hypothetical protein
MRPRSAEHQLAELLVVSVPAGRLEYDERLRQVPEDDVTQHCGRPPVPGYELKR